jgi:hypothetical protein
VQNVIATGWQLPDDGSWHWVCSSTGSRVARIVCDNEEFYFKVFSPRGLWDVIKPLWRGSRAWRCSIQTLALQSYGFAAPSVIAAKTRGVVPWIVMESARGIAWGDFVCSFLTEPDTVALLLWKRELIRALGAEIGRLHKLGFVHGDLNPFNVLVDTSVRKPTFYLIDNERTRRPLYLLDRERVRNLVQISFFQSPQMQRTDHLRFWSAYCEAAGLSKARQRRLRIQACERLHARLVVCSSGSAFGNSHLSSDVLNYLPD